jgi:hypothetical protein
MVRVTLLAFRAFPIRSVGSKPFAHTQLQEAKGMVQIDTEKRYLQLQGLVWVGLNLSQRRCYRGGN